MMKLQLGKSLSDCSSCILATCHFAQSGKGRKLLGWTFRGSAYCQLIRAQNKEKRLEWAESYLHDGFEDVVWTDETTVQLETHRRFCCRKNGQKPRYKPRPKHPVKVHVWAGISWKGRTEICIFEGS